MYEKVSFERAKAIMDAQPHVLLDVRDEEEYITGHAAGAVLLPLGELDDVRAAEVIPDLTTPVLVYCRSGRRSKEAAGKLVKLGYTNIVEFGGIIDWKGETVSGE